MRPFILSIAPYTAASANAIALSQTPAAGGQQAITLNGALVVNGVAILDQPRQVAIVSAGNDTNRVFYIVGTGRKGNSKVEAVRGANAGTAQTVRAFKTVRQILVDGNTAGAITVGTTTVVDTDWAPVDYQTEAFGMSLMLSGVSATVGGSFSVQWTNSRLGWKGYSDDGSSSFAGIFDRFFPDHLVANHDTLVNILPAAADPAVGNIVVPVTAIRLRSNLVFTGGTVRLTAAMTGE
jgi:hypothetical protein